ncbi:hypothetical protein CB1_002337032 [Camelus ferus]|nr:hypothetical protein CB1_002337032 [Camelus ferus]
MQVLCWSDTTKPKGSVSRTALLLARCIKITLPGNQSSRCDVGEPHEGPEGGGIFLPAGRPGPQEDVSVGSVRRTRKQDVLWRLRAPGGLSAQPSPRARANMIPVGQRSLVVPQGHRAQAAGKSFDGLPSRVPSTCQDTQSPKVGVAACLHTVEKQGLGTGSPMSPTTGCDDVDHPADMAVGPPLGEKGAISNGGSDRVAVKNLATIVG